MMRTGLAAFAGAAAGAAVATLVTARRPLPGAGGAVSAARHTVGHMAGGTLPGAATADLSDHETHPGSPGEPVTGPVTGVFGTNEGEHDA